MRDEPNLQRESEPGLFKCEVHLQELDCPRPVPIRPEPVGKLNNELTSI